MTNAVLSSRQHGTSTLTDVLGTFAKSAWAVLRDWRRRSRSRWELSTYYHERKDLGFAPELDAELSKPFWRT